MGVLFVLACSDVLSFKLADASIRYFYAAVFILPLICQGARTINPYLLKRLLVLLVCLLPSVFVSIDVSRSFMYYSWVILSMIVCYFYAKVLFALDEEATADINVRGSFLERLIIVSYRLQLLIAFLLVAFGLHDRPTFFYYEPSYFSISLSIYAALVLKRFFSEEKYILDFGFIVVYAVLSFSAAFLIIISVLVLLNLYSRSLVGCSRVLFVSMLILFIYVILFDDLNTEIIKSFVVGDVTFFDLLLRGGNRLPRMIVAYDTFLNNPWYGIGLGGFESYSYNLSLPEAFDPSDYMVITGLPAVNVFVELAATAGIFGLVGFAYFTFPVVRWGFATNFRSPYFQALIAMVVVLTLESNYLRPYFWICFFICWFQRKTLGFK